MNETRQSLLLRAQVGETAASKELTNLYRPLILAWLIARGCRRLALDGVSGAEVAQELGLFVEAVYVAK